MSSCHVSSLLIDYGAELMFSLAGETILDGTDFRNTAHLRFKADLFVPCGGRYDRLISACCRSDKSLIVPRL
jgi:hypothetical protein